MLPVEVKWKSRPVVTLLRDAAHPTTPFAGVGVNVAMADAFGRPPPTNSSNHKGLYLFRNWRN